MNIGRNLVKRRTFLEMRCNIRNSDIDRRLIVLFCLRRIQFPLKKDNDII